MCLTDVPPLPQKRHHSSDSATSGRDRSYSTDSGDALPSRLKEEAWLLEISAAFLQQYVQYLQSIGFILVQVRPQSPARRCVPESLECVCHMKEMLISLLLLSLQTKWLFVGEKSQCTCLCFRRFTFISLQATVELNVKRLQQ